MQVGPCFRLAEPPRQRQNATALFSILDDWHDDDFPRHNPIQRPDPARVTPAEPFPTAMQSDSANLPIREAASEIIDIEHSVPLDGEFDVALGDTFADDAIRARYQRQERTATICHYRLNDVTLDTSTMLLVRGRRRIPETRFLVPDDAYADMLTKPLHPTETVPTNTTSSALIGQVTTTTTGWCRPCRPLMPACAAPTIAGSRWYRTVNPAVSGGNPAPARVSGPASADPRHIQSLSLRQC